MKPASDPALAAEFTFHYGSTYTEVRECPVKDCTLIYIPLWFYLYLLPDLIYLPVLQFTFHYGSTYTGGPYTLIPHFEIFTFHYGSTYTFFPAAVAPQNPHLHSTMVLLIQIRLRSGFSLHPAFTFHYGSTYTKLDKIRRYGIVHLHSTMVLLILQFLAKSQNLLLIYIPLWFYLYWFCRCKFCDCKSIYIPLWFYLYTEYVKKCLHYLQIYIPLWFYLYSCHSFHDSLPIYLHSTMVLLIRAISKFIKIHTRIYIPLWFYLYAAYENEYEGVAKFTFHYGSTYTAKSSISAHSFTRFTFHYGSTYTKRAGMITLLSVKKFTFHYGSTYTWWLSYFYFDPCIYIPLWFYLYAAAVFHRISGFLIYIPLWFYLYPCCFMAYIYSIFFL